MIKWPSVSFLFLARIFFGKRTHPMVAMASFLQQRGILHTTAFGDRLPPMGKISLDDDNNNNNNHSCNQTLVVASHSNSLRIGLSMRGCSASGKRRVDRNGHGVFAHSYLQQQVLRDFEIGFPNAELPTGQKDSHHGKLLAFPPRPLPEKIVVAVDVDEGISLLIF